MIVFPMCGLSKRFRAAGFDVPKYTLPLGAGSMFRSAVCGFESLFELCPFLFICRADDGAEDFIRRELSEWTTAPRTWRIVVLKQDTSGQADTVYQGLKALDVADEEPLTIFNIDSHHRHFRYPEDFSLSDVDGYLEVFAAEGEHWSFVRPAPGSDRLHAVAEVAEKTRISTLCSTGLYYFRRAEMFFALFEATLDRSADALQGGERYIAPLYDSAVNLGFDIRFHRIDPAEILFSGTPDEYRAARRVLGPRVAFCVSGQVRGPRAFLHQIRDLAEELGAEVFFSTWDMRGRKTFRGASNINQVRRIIGPQAGLTLPLGAYRKMDLMFPRTNDYLESQKIPVDTELKDILPDAEIDIEPETRLSLEMAPGCTDHNSLRMLYKIWRCNRMKRARESREGRRFDYAIRFRPDCLPDAKSFLASRALSAKVQFPESTPPSGKPRHDLFWMGSKEQDDYLSSLFGRAVMMEHGGWKGIHRELEEFASASPYTFETVEALRGINEFQFEEGPLQAPEPHGETARILNSLCEDYAAPGPDLEALEPDPKVRHTLSEVMRLFATRDRSDIHDLLCRLESGLAAPAPAVFRGLAIFLLGLTPPECSALRPALIALIGELVERERAAAAAAEDPKSPLPGSFYFERYFETLQDVAARGEEPDASGARGWLEETAHRVSRLARAAV